MPTSSVRIASSYRADAVTVIDETGTVLLFDAMAERLFGWTAAEVVGTDVARLMPPAVREAHRSQLASYLATGESHVLGRELEVSGLRQDGMTFPMALRVSELRVEGGPRLFVGVIQDLRARRTAAEADAAGQASVSLVHATLEATADGILVVDREGRFVRFNRQFATMWRIPAEVLGTGKDDEAIAFVLSQLERPESFLAKVHELYDQPEAESSDTLEFKDGRVFERYSKPQWLAERPVGRVWSFRDVTAQRNAERALRRSEEQLRQSQKMEAVGRLAGGVAHDFNNLLLVISGCGELARKRTSADPQLSALIDEILAAGRRAAGLTHQLLAFSRQQVLKPRTVDLNTLIVDTAEMLRRMIGEDVLLATSLAPALDHVRVDPGQMVQVLMNLAVNARDAMPSGGQLTIETMNVELDAAFVTRHPALRAGPHVRCAVSDTGCGMDAATQSHVFEPFFTTKSLGKGTGLGLSTVSGIVDQSGGAISVYSEVGRGTTFNVYFPVADETSSPAIAAVTAPASRNGGETVLLVDDDAAARGVVEKLLTASGFRVLVAASPEDAFTLAEARKGRIDVLLTDVVMPRMSGSEVASRVVASHPETRVVYMSGYAPGAIVQHGVLEGDVAFLPKPFTEAALMRAITGVLSRVDG
jgi:PAS domain S-box-containing protein